VLPTLVAELANQVVDVETGSVGVRENARHEFTEPARFFVQRLRNRAAGRDERTDTASGLEHADALELCVNARHRVGVDAQVDRQLTDGRQLIPGAKPAGGDGGAESTLELGVDRRGVGGIDIHQGHLNYYTSSLIQVTQEKRRGIGPA